MTGLGIVAMLLLKWLADDAKAWLAWCAQRFFDLSVRLLPLSERERYGEEWRGDIESLPGTAVCTAQFVWAALTIRALVIREALLQGWTLLRIQTAIVGLLLYCWLNTRMARSGTEKSLIHEHSGEGSNLAIGLALVLIAVAWIRQSQLRAAGTE